MPPVEISSKQATPGIAGHFQGEERDFSLVVGGPLYQLFRKAHLEDETTAFPLRRILVIEAVAWLPLLLLSIVGSLSGNVGLVSFWRDIEVHVRFLVALPVLIMAEIIVHQRLSPVVHRFVERRIVTTDDLPRFDAAIDSAVRLRNSNVAEIGLLGVVYTFGCQWHLGVFVLFVLNLAIFPIFTLKIKGVCGRRFFRRSALSAQGHAPSDPPRDATEDKFEHHRLRWSGIRPPPREGGIPNVGTAQCNVPTLK